MATIEGLERLGEHLANAESEAMRGLVEHLRTEPRVGVRATSPASTLGVYNLFNELERLRGEEAS